MFKNLSFEKRLLWGVSILYICAWLAHLYIGTLALQGFTENAALTFLINLSNSYVFNKPGNWVHIFSVGLPREAQVFMNALGLQGALWLGIKNPWTLKYVFVFWQFALPGFLYLALFAVLWRNGKLPWTIFPLLSWAVLSVSGDIVSDNSTRWAMPVFWMHFYLVLLAGPRIRPWPLAGVLLAGAAMWGGLYESVFLNCGLCLIIGVLLWVREKNKIPFLYALTAVPGACRALLSYIAIGHAAPNGFHGLRLPDIFAIPFVAAAAGNFKMFSNMFSDWVYLLLIGAPIICAVAIAFAPKSLLPRFNIFLTALIVVAGTVLLLTPPNIWLLYALRFDYVILSLGLMAWAGMSRIWRLAPESFAMPIAILALLAGTALWVVQSEEGVAWQTCRANYTLHKGNRPLVVGTQLDRLIQHNEKISYINDSNYDRCTCGEWTAWTDLVLAPDYQIDQFTLFSFWQDFSFVEKNGEAYMRTNNWTLMPPSVQQSEADLPLKTLLYDLTPLYKELGQGPFVIRTQCLDPSKVEYFWEPYLTALDNDKRILVHVCPR